MPTESPKVHPVLLPIYIVPLAGVALLCLCYATALNVTHLARQLAESQPASPRRPVAERDRRLIALASHRDELLQKQQALKQQVAVRSKDL